MQARIHFPGRTAAAAAVVVLRHISLKHLRDKSDPPGSKVTTDATSPIKIRVPLVGRLLGGCLKMLGSKLLTAVTGGNVTAPQLTTPASVNERA